MVTPALRPSAAYDNQQAIPSDSGAKEAADRRAREDQFDADMRQMAAEEAKLRANERLTADEYFAKQRELEKKLLEKMENHPEQYTDTEKKFAAGVKQSHEAHNSLAKKANDFKAQPGVKANQEAYAAELEKREALARAQAGSDQFKDDPEVSKRLTEIANLERDSITAIRNGQSPDDAQRQISEKVRELDRIMASDPEKYNKKMSEFIDANQNSADPKVRTALEESGMVKMNESIKELNKTHEQKKVNRAVGADAQQPNQPARTGGVTYTDEQGHAVAITENRDGQKFVDADKKLSIDIVTEAIDDGKGHTTVNKYTVNHMDGHLEPLVPTAQQGTPGPEKATEAPARR